MKCKNCGHQIAKNEQGDFFHIQMVEGIEKVWNACSSSLFCLEDNCECANPEPKKEHGLSSVTGEDCVKKGRLD